jgi:SPP1 family predicted phage head-tail adaptor
MNFSRADRKIRIEAQSEAQDSLGQQSTVWSLITNGNVWAQVSIGGGTELMKSKKLFDTADAVFTIRYRSDVTPTHRIVYNNANWNIIAIEEVGRRDSLRIVARRYNGL